MREKQVIIPARVEGLLPAKSCRRIDLSGQTMGTGWRFSGFVPPGLEAEHVARACERVFRRITQQMSNWEADSAVSRFNAAPKGASIPFSDDGITVIRKALEIAAKSDGAFDPCLGAHAEELRFGDAKDAIPPWYNTHRAWEKLELPAGVSQLMQPGGVKLDLSAIAKGFAVDQMASEIKSLGVNSFIAEIGGEFAGVGIKPDGQPWWVEIESIGSTDRHFICALHNLALASSGTGRRMRSSLEGTYHHIALRYVADRTSPTLTCVTVFHERCMEADAWATALYAAGPRQGPILAEKEGLAALFQFDACGPHISDALRPMLS